MTEKTDRERSEENQRAPRDIEESNAAPGPIEAESSSVETDDKRRGGDLAMDSQGGDEQDPWLEPMKDLARLVIAAFEADPHRFD